MSDGIDNRIVRMQFDNKQFEQGVGTTLKSLDNLKTGLQLDGIAGNVDKIASRFSALGIIGVEALQNITNRAVDAGIALTKSLTIDPIMQGYGEYELKMGAIQTIMAGTGASLETVNAKLDELNTYADKTIYSFSDMTQNIGKFTNAGVDLEDAVGAIQGISNAAALSGSNANEASRAMYNFAQALSAGHVKLIDWKSIENANMSTKEFRQQLIDAAVAAGTLEKRADGMYNVLTTGTGGKKFGQTIDAMTNFNDSLSAQWMTTDALIPALNDYADANTEIGANAYAAATDVKTLTQLMGTMQEAVGSGWAQSFEILFGDFEESKSFFTELNGLFGGMIGASADARNNLLTSWKKMGGRDDLLDSIRNIISAVQSLIAPIKEAFNSIFPPMTAKRLVEITKGIKEFTSKLILGKNESGLLKNTFKGLFAVVSLIGKAFKAVWDAIKPLFGGFDELGGGILKMTSGIGDWLVNLNKAAGATDFFGKALSRVKDILKVFKDFITNVFDNAIVSYYEGGMGLAGVVEVIFDTLADLARVMFDVWAIITGKDLSEIKEKVVSFIQGIRNNVVGFIHDLQEKYKFPGFEFLGTLLEKVGGWFGVVKDKSAEAFSNIKQGAKDGLGEANDKLSKFKNFLVGIKEGLSNFASTIKNAFSKVGTYIKEALGPVGDRIKEAFSEVTIRDAIGTGLIGGIFLVIKNLVGNMDKILDGFAEVVDNASKVLDSMRGALEAYQTNLKADTLLKIAGAVAILVASLIALTFVDSDKALLGLIPMTVLLGELVGVLKVLGSTSKKGIINTAQVKASATAMVILAGAVAILAKALVSMNSFSSGKDMWSAVGALTVLMAALVASVKILSTGKTKIDGADFIKTSIGLVIFAGAVKQLAKAMAKLGAMKPEELKQGLVAMGFILAEVAAFIKYAELSELKEGKKVIMAVAISLLMLTAVVKLLGGMDILTLVKGIGSIGVLLLGLGLFMKSINGMDAVGAASTLIALSVALMLLVIPIKALGAMSWEELGRGLFGLAGALTVLIIALSVMKDANFGNVAATMVLLAVALNLLIIPIKIMGEMPWQNLVTGIGALAAILLVFIIAAYALAPIAPLLLTISGAIGIFGLAILGIGAGITLLSIGLAALAVISGASALAIVASLSVVILGLAATIPAVAVLIAKGIIAFVDTLATGIPVLMKVLELLIVAILDLLIGVVPPLIELVWVIFEKLLEVFVEASPIINQALIDLLISFLECIEKNTPMLSKAWTDLMVMFINETGKQSGRLAQAGFDLIIDFIDGITDAINNNTERLVISMNNLIMAMINAAITVIKGLFDLDKQIRDLGRNLIMGFIKGIKDKIYAVGDAVKDVGKKALNGLKGFLGIKSPSRVFMKLGEQTDEGFVKGLEGYSSKVGKAAEGVGSEAIDGIKSSISQIADAVNSDIDAEPTIRPVLDLTDIQNGSKKIGDMMGGMSGTAKLAYDTSGDIQRKNARVLGNEIMTFDPPKNPRGEIPVNNFYITGSNPKEIANEVSRILQKQVEKEQTAWA